MKRLYALLLYLFPRSYREEYGDELQAVFNLSLDDARNSESIEVVWVILRELIGLPRAILYEHLRKPKYDLVAQPSIFAKDNYMKTIKEIRWAAEDSWITTLASLLPLWLLYLAIMAEGFPQPPILVEWAVTALVLALAVSIVLLWKGWLEIDILLYSLFPFILVIVFDEISTTYKTPLILLCALIMTSGIIGAKRSSSLTVRWLILLIAAVATWVLASHAIQSYWQMVGDLGYGAFPSECMPDTQDCPLIGNQTPWWVLFFSR